MEQSRMAALRIYVLSGCCALKTQAIPTLSGIASGPEELNALRFVARRLAPTPG